MRLGSEPIQSKSLLTFASLCFDKEQLNFLSPMTFEIPSNKWLYPKLKSSLLLETYFRQNSIVRSERLMSIDRPTKIELMIDSGFLWEIKMISFFSWDE